MSLVINEGFFPRHCCCCCCCCCGAHCSPRDASAAGSGAPSFPLFPSVSESRRCVLMMMACKKDFKGLGPLLSDMGISLCCAQTFLTPLVFAVVQHTQGKKTLKKLKGRTCFSATVMEIWGRMNCYQQQDHSLNSTLHAKDIPFLRAGCGWTDLMHLVCGCKLYPCHHRCKAAQPLHHLRLWLEVVQLFFFNAFLCLFWDNVL